MNKCYRMNLKFLPLKPNFLISCLPHLLLNLKISLLSPPISANFRKD